MAETTTTPRVMPAGAITRQQSPSNIEFPFELLDGFTTPNEHFYVRSHHPLPKVDASNFRLHVEGHVEHPLELSLDDLKKMPQQTRAATLECAGNGRVFLVPQVEGAQWELGAVSTAQWTGVPLSEILAKAGVKPGAVDIVFEGADKGKAKEKPIPPGEIHYAHSVPMRKVDDVLLATAMNGKPLPMSHGFPLRAIVGGWYGMASVKWVHKIAVLDRTFDGYYQIVDYAYWTEVAGNAVRTPIEEMSCKAQIARPAKQEVLPRDSDYTVTGAAWTGDTDVVKVEISTDGGENFSEAELLGEPVRHAWRLWRFPWHTPKQTGPQLLLARATDALGRTQPKEHDLSTASYVIKHMLPCECVVE